MGLDRLVAFLQESLRGYDPPIIIYFDRVGKHFASYPLKEPTHPPPPWLVKGMEAAFPRSNRRNGRGLPTSGGS